MGELVEEQRVANDHIKELTQAYAGSKATLGATENTCPSYDTRSEQIEVLVVDPRQIKAIGTR